MTVQPNHSARSAAMSGFLTLAVALCSCTPEPKPANPPAAQPAATQAAPAGSGPHWSYEGEAGPANWGKLDAKFVACAEGLSQSPIDIASTAPVAGSATKFTYRPSALHVVNNSHLSDGLNNGHTIQVNCPGGDTVLVGDKPYSLAQFHFHSPSEHTVDGKHAAMEMHLVHKSADGALAVLGVLIEEGAENAAFAPIWNNLPAEKGDEKHYSDVIYDLNALLPADHSVYRYDGSLTTPPCSEGVSWMVMRNPIQLSADQIGKFRAHINGNNRPVNPLNGRIVQQMSIGN